MQLLYQFTCNLNIILLGKFICLPCNFYRQLCKFYIKFSCYFYINFPSKQLLKPCNLCVSTNLHVLMCIYQFTCTYVYPPFTISIIYMYLTNEFQSEPVVACRTMVMRIRFYLSSESEQLPTLIIKPTTQISKP